MATNIEGVGMIFQRKDGLLRPVRASAVSAAEDVSVEDVQAFPLSGVGNLQITDTIKRSSTWTLTLTPNSIDDLDLPFLYDQQEGTVASISVPNIVVMAVPTGGSITVTGLTVDQADVEVTILKDDAPGSISLSQIASAGTPTSTQFEVTANTVSVHTSHVGAIAAIYYRSLQEDLDVIGGPVARNPLGNLEVFFKYKATRTETRTLWFPKIFTNSGSTINPVADNFERTYRAAVPTELGWVVPYMDWS